MSAGVTPEQAANAIRDAVAVLEWELAVLVERNRTLAAEVEQLRERNRLLEAVAVVARTLLTLDPRRLLEGTPWHDLHAALAALDAEEHGDE